MWTECIWVFSTVILKSVMYNIKVQFISYNLNWNSLESIGTAAAFVTLAVFFGLGLSLAVFSLIVAESIVFCRLKLLVTAAEVVMVWLWFVVDPVTGVFPMPEHKIVRKI